MAFDFFDNLETYAGATRQLPQRINIGPDRIVDVQHGRMAMSMLNGSAPLTTGNCKKYLANCDREMARYRKSVLAKGYKGLAACCRCYLYLYRGHPGCEHARDREGVWRITRSQFSAECSALGLEETDHVTTDLR